MDFSSIHLRAQDIRDWAEQRNLIAGSSPADQYLKLMEEVGKVVVAIKILSPSVAKSNSLIIGECVEAAWREIKGLKGKMENDRPTEATGAH